MSSDHLRILMMGWHYPDEAVLERQTFAAESIRFDIRRWGLDPQDRLSEDRCAEYDAVIQHHGAERFREPRRGIATAGSWCAPALEPTTSTSPPGAN
jgi:hypothetical protein